MHHILRFFRNRAGVTAIEYCLLLVLISSVIVAGAGDTGESLKKAFGTVSKALAEDNGKGKKDKPKNKKDKDKD